MSECAFPRPLLRVPQSRAARQIALALRSLVRCRVRVRVSGLTLTPTCALRSLPYPAAPLQVSNATRARLDVLQQHWLQPQMVLLDVGMATELTDEDQRNMVGLFRSFAAMDGQACGEWTLSFSGGWALCAWFGAAVVCCAQ